MLNGPTVFTVSSTSSCGEYSWPGCFSKFFEVTIGEKDDKIEGGRGKCKKTVNLQVL